MHHYPLLVSEAQPGRATHPEVYSMALLFGPLGLFYASWRGGLFMSFVCLGVGVATVGVGLLFAWPVCILWAYATAGNSWARGQPVPGPRRVPHFGL